MNDQEKRLLDTLDMILQRGRTCYFGPEREKDYKKARKVLDSFRQPKPARVGWLRFTPETAENVKAVELTDPVKARLGKDGGVSRDDVHVITGDYGHCDRRKMTDAIMDLIAASAVEVSENA